MQKINIYNIIKKLQNLKDRIFYSPIYGEVHVELLDITKSQYPILIKPIDPAFGLTGINLDEYGYYCKDSDGECLLYLSKTNRDWKTFIPNDLPIGTPVVMTDNPTKSWELGWYTGDQTVKSKLDQYSYCFDYIVPVDKFNFKDWSFNNEDNYGEAYEG